MNAITWIGVAAAALTSVQAKVVVRGVSTLDIVVGVLSTMSADQIFLHCMMRAW